MRTLNKIKPVWPWVDGGANCSEELLDDSSWPRISIVTPSFNQVSFLEQTIISVLSQGYPNLEYIIIDGGSTDGSIDIIKKYEEHLHYWHSKPDNGQYAAINKGFEYATGEIFAWLNSDDLFCPWAFNTIGQVFSQFPHVNWLSSLYPLNWDAQSYCASASRLAGFSKEAFLDSCYLPIGERKINYIQQESTFWRSELWRKVGGISENVGLVGDFDLWCRFYHLTELYGISSPLGGFRMHGNQRSTDLNRYNEEADIVLSEFREKYDYKEKSKPLLRNILSKLPMIRVFSELYYRANIEKYTGHYLVCAGTNHPGRWKEVRKNFIPHVFL